jgi:predicted enzyme related to lactoylglutathione lyase
VFFKMSKAVAVQADDVKAANDFYSNVLGFPAEEQEGITGIDADPLTIYVDSRKHCDGLLMELIVEDAEAAREYLVMNGCEVVTWGGAGKSCIVRDPFGVHFNIWEQRAD